MPPSFNRDQLNSNTQPGPSVAADATVSANPVPDSSHHPPPWRHWGVYLLLGVVVLSGFGYGATRLWADKADVAKPQTPQVAPALSADEQPKVANIATGPTQLDISALTAASANIDQLLAKALQVSGAATIQGNLTVGGNGTFSGTLSASNFTGSGGGLSGVNATLLDGQSRAYYESLATTGNTQLNDLTSRAALKPTANTFTGPNTFSGGLVSSGSTVLGATTISSLILSAPLSVAFGGTGVSSVPAASVLYGQGGPTMGVATAPAAGLCLLSGSTDVQWGSCSGGGAGVATLNGASGVLTIAGATAVGTTITINDASTASKGIAQFSATNFSVTGGVVNTIQNLATTSSPTFAGLSLTSALPVTSGGTGATALTNNGVVIGQGTSALTTVTAGGAGLCLVSGAGAPSFQACPGAGGVSSVNSQTGGVTIANATAAAGTITIQDASTAQKGLAQFSSTNFTVTAGSVNTIQNIATTASPTFAGINTNAITPGAALTVGSTAQTLTLQGSNTTVTATNGANTATLTFVAPTANVTYRLQTAAAGTYDVCTTAGNCVGVGGSVSTSGGSANTIPKYTSASAIGPSLLTDNGTLVTVGGNLSVSGTTSLTGALTLTTALAVTSGGTGATSAGGARTSLGAAASGANSDITSLSGLTTALSIVQGGTGATSLTANGVLLGNGTSAISSLATGTAGLCLVSQGAGLNPAWAACPGGSGVSSLNSQTGAITIANASGSGGTVTIDDASTSGKGIASFNSSNFSVSSGAVNTIQNIGTGATPTFAGINANSLTPSSALTVGATAQSFTIQGNASSTVTVTSGGFTTTVGFSGVPTASQTYNFDRTAAAGTYTICTTAGNCVGTGGGVTTAGGTTGALARFTGAQTLGDSIITDNGSTVTVAGAAVVQGSNGLTLGAASTAAGRITLYNATNANTTTLVSGAAGSNLTFTLPVADGSAGQCLTTNSFGVLSFSACLSGAGGGSGGVASLNGLSGALTIADATTAGSTITINDASTSAKGIAQFNATNFQATSGTINTIQNIATTSSPTFAALSLTGTASLTLGTASNLGQLSLRDGSTAFSSTFQSAALGANRTITVPNASGTLAVSASGNIALDASGNISFTGQLPVTAGGTGAGSFTSNGVLYGNGTSTLGVTAAGTTGQCLIATTGSAPTWGSCGGGGGVTSLNSQTGAVTINNASGSGGAITIDDATTAAKGIASFSGTNFSVANGAVDTIQGISTGASPTFAALTLTGTNTLTLGTAANLGQLRLRDGSSAFIATFQASTLTSNRTITIPNAGGTLAVSASGNIALDASGNIAFSGQLPVANGGTGASDATTARTNLSAAASGANADITSTTALNTITPGAALTVGATSQSFTLQGNGSSTITATNGASTTTFAFQAPTANVTYTLQTAAAGSYNICTSVGNCAGAGGGVTTAGGTTNAIAKFTGAQTLGDSNISDNGSVVTVSGDLTVTDTLTLDGPGAGLHIEAQDNSGNFATLYTATGDLTFYVGLNIRALMTQDGKFGVGLNANPQYTLDIDGDINTSANLRTGGTIRLTNAGALQNVTADTGILTSGTLGVARGGTGLASYTTGDLLYASSSSALSGLAAVASGSCLVSAGVGTAPTWGSCGTGVTLQAAYDNGNAIATTNNRNLSVTLADTATDPNFLVNIASGSSGKFAVQSNGTDVASINSTQLVLGASTSLNGSLRFLNSSNSNTVTFDSGATSGSYSLTLPTGGPGTSQCLATDSVTASQLVFTACGSGVTTVGTFSGSSQTNGATISGSTITFGPADATNPGMVSTGTQTFAGNKTFTGNTTFTGTLLQRSDSATALALQDSTGTYNNLVFDSSTGHLRVYDHSNPRTAYADIYYSGGAAIFAASTGVTQIGSGAGDVTINLTNNGEKFNFTHTGTTAASTNDFQITRQITGGVVALSGNVLRVEDLSTYTGGGSSSPNLLYLNQNNTLATGNLILAQTGGSTTRFQVATTGAVSIASGQGITGLGALSVDAASAQALNLGITNTNAITIGNAGNNSSVTINSGTGTIAIGTGAQTRTVNIATGTAAQTVTLGSASSSSSLTLQAGTGTIAIGSTAQARTITLGTGAAAQTVTVGSTNSTSSLTLQAGTGNLNLQTQGTGGINIGTNAVSQPITIGNATGGALRLGQNAGSLQIDGPNFDVATSGAVTLLGGLSTDVLTQVSAGLANALTLQPGTSTGASSNGALTSIKGGDGSGTTSVTGGTLALQGGSATGASGTRTGGNVTIDAGTGATANGTITIGASNAASITIGNSASNITTTISGLVLAKPTTGNNSSTAVVFQDAGGTPYFTGNSSTATVTVTNLTVTGTLTVNGHIVSGGSTPTYAAGTAACTTPTIAIAGTDTAGLITVTTGTGCGATGKLTTVTFASAFSAAPRVSLTPAETNAAGLTQTYIDSGTISTTAFDINTNTAPTDATTYKWYYHVIQ